MDPIFIIAVSSKMQIIIVRVSKIHYVFTILLQVLIILSSVLIYYQLVQLIIAHNIFLRADRLVLRLITFIFHKLFC